MANRHAKHKRRTARYSRFVGVVKVLLPLMAVTILSTVFLLGDDDRFDQRQVFTPDDFNALDDTDQLTRARFAGATTQGDYLSFSTTRVSPDPARENVMVFSRLSGSAKFVTGQEVQLVAPSALFFISDNRISMPKGGEISTSDGYRARMESLNADLSTGDITGNILDGSGPLGEITAGHFEMVLNDGGNRVLWFSQGVRLKLNQRVNE